jgi:hypothetical protein
MPGERPGHSMSPAASARHRQFGRVPDGSHDVAHSGFLFGPQAGLPHGLCSLFALESGATSGPCFNPRFASRIAASRHYLRGRACKHGRRRSPSTLVEPDAGGITLYRSRLRTIVVSPLTAPRETLVGMGPNRESRGSTNVSLSRFELLPLRSKLPIHRAVAGGRPLGPCMALVKVLRSPVSLYNEQHDRSPHPTTQ